MKKLIIIIVIFILIFIGSFNGCIEEKEKPKIIIGTDKDIGFGIEFAKNVFNKDYTIETQIFDFKNLIGIVQQNFVDVIVSNRLVITNESLEQISFSVPYYNSNQYVLTRFDKNLVITNKTSFTGFIIGVKTNSIGEQQIHNYFLIKNDIIEGYVNPFNITIKNYNSYADALQDLYSKHIDVVFMDKTVYDINQKKDWIKNVYMLDVGNLFGLGVKKDNVVLLKKINDVLVDYMVSDEYIALIKKYSG